MDELIDKLIGVIAAHITRDFRQKDDKLYFGELTEFSSQTNDDDKIILLNVAGKAGGYVASKNNKPYEVSYPGREESYVFDIYEDKVKLIVQPYSTTASEPIHRQAVFKEDWVKRDPFEGWNVADYTEHRKIIDHAIQEFMNSQRHNEDDPIELWLPKFF